MKKVILWTLLTSLVVAPWVFAATEDENMEVMPINAEAMPISAEVSDDMENSELFEEYNVILRNNNLESDYDYNNVNYYNSKLKAEDIVIPEEIKDNSTRVYFLVEEGARMMYFEDSMAVGWRGWASQVEQEYNYRVVDFEEWKEEYNFENKDLVEDFWEDEYTSVSITLMADMRDWTKLALSNSAYIDITSKRNTFSNILSESDVDMYYGYYNTQNLEDYLLTLSEWMERKEYKSMLSKAESRIKTAMEKNNSSMDELLDSINYQADFEKNLDEFQTHSETDQLLNSLRSAVKNQLQNVRAFDAIDTILR